MLKDIDEEGQKAVEFLVQTLPQYLEPWMVLDVGAPKEGFVNFEISVSGVPFIRVSCAYSCSGYYWIYDVLWAPDMTQVKMHSFSTLYEFMAVVREELEKVLVASL